MSRADQLIDLSRTITRDLEFLHAQGAIPFDQWQDCLRFLSGLFADVELERKSRPVALCELTQFQRVVDLTLGDALERIHGQTCWFGKHPETKFVQ